MIICNLGKPLISCWFVMVCGTNLREAVPSAGQYGNGGVPWARHFRGGGPFTIAAQPRLSLSRVPVFESVADAFRPGAEDWNNHCAWAVKGFNAPEN